MGQSSTYHALQSRPDHFLLLQIADGFLSLGQQHVFQSAGAAFELPTHGYILGEYEQRTLIWDKELGNVSCPGRAQGEGPHSDLGHRIVNPRFPRLKIKPIVALPDSVRAIATCLRNERDEME